jgi:putative DNA primase/helicase
VQRCVGYTLTGSNVEQCFFVLFGTGSNGKSTFLSTVMHLLGVYSATIQPDSITKKANSAAVARSDIARLHGVRMVASNEINEDECINESLIKQITGGENITARFRYKDEFEFMPEFKLFISTNYKPKIIGTDNGIWRRIVLIPFEVTINESDMDKNLIIKMKEEMSGILNWAIEGCKKWLINGLQVPEEVKEAIKNYRDEMDTIKCFINQVLVHDELGKVSVTELNSIFQMWCKDMGETNYSSWALPRRLKKEGYFQIKDAKQRYWSNLRIK